MTKWKPSLALVLLLTSCIHSLHPPYRPDDVVFEPALLGEWINESNTWTISRAGNGKSYRVVLADKNGRTGVFLGHVFEIGGHRFVDLYPVQTEQHSAEFHRDHAIAMHTFYLLTRTEPSPRLAFLDDQWLNGHLKENPNALRHEWVGKNLLITAPTSELQAFLLRHVSTKGAFAPTAGEWRRAG